MMNLRTTRLNKFISWLGLTLLVCLLSGQANAVPLLYELRYNPVIEGQTELEFIFDEELYIEPSIQVFNEPARIEVFFDEADFDESLEELIIDKAGVKNVKSEFVDEGFRVTIYLEFLKIYQTRVSQDRFYLTISDNVVTDEAVQQSQTEDDAYINKIQAIDFRRGVKGDGRLLVFLEENMAAVDVLEKAGKIIIEFHNTDILGDLIYQLDVVDFGTVVTKIETFKEASNSRLVVDTSGSFKYEYQQVDNIFTLSVIKDESARSFLDGGREYKGEPISLNFQDIPVRTVLQIIADYNGFNLVTSDSVQGNITLRLDGVPWDQALDIVLKVRGLDKRMDGNILMVAPGEELAAREARELQARKQVQELEPLYTEFIQVNYSKADEMAKLLKGEGTSLLTERGNVSTDTRTNVLIVRDTASTIESVQRMVKVLDRPVEQVVIESRIVTVNDTASDGLGVRWGVSDQQNSLGISGTLAGAQTIQGGTVPASNQRLNVNLPVAGAGSIGFHVAKLRDGTILDLELQAIENENQGEIIASPRLTTANEQKARIEQGVELPYVSASSSGATTVTFKKAVLSLEVTPHITPDDKVVLDLKITQDTQGDIVQTATGQAVAINTQEINTQVLVNNGETIVLGGVYQNSTTNSETKVPLLGDIPYLGALFRSTRSENIKRELMIFVTPRISQQAPIN
ncbi:type IV pilus secretin PilQ [Algicola sagamiensis]|uniref:type IV pilus secretin PilQ n=1 Tax=Algicola sagamiensis TaxID=163869 RepID=UPI001FE1BA0E|nr:type IV pilus secretin PilQ family protein [Algicola sagamiensis]